MQNSHKKDPQVRATGLAHTPILDRLSLGCGEPSDHTGHPRGERKPFSLGPGYQSQRRILIGLAWLRARLLAHGSGVNFDWKARVMGSAWESGVRHYELSLIRTTWHGTSLVVVKNPPSNAGNMGN